MCAFACRLTCLLVRRVCRFCLLLVLFVDAVLSEDGLADVAPGCLAFVPGSWGASGSGPGVFPGAGGRAGAVADYAESGADPARGHGLRSGGAGLGPLPGQPDI